MPKIDYEAWYATRWRRAGRSSLRHRGSLWQQLDDGTVVRVFRRKWDNQFGWLIDDPEYDEPTFSEAGYETEDDACEAVLSYVVNSI